MKVFLLLPLLILITIPTNAEEGVISDHSPYFRIFEKAKENVKSAINRSLRKHNEVIPSLSLSPEVDKQTFLQAAIDKLSEKSGSETLLEEPEQSLEICSGQVMATLAAIGEGQFWAVKMFDAVDKLPSGILDGKTRLYGSYDGCLSIQSYINNTGNPAPLPQYEGQYCWASIHVPLEAILFSLNLDMGICMPDGCNSTNAQAVLNTILPMIRIGGQPVWAYNVMCQKKNIEYDTRAIALLTLCGFFALLMVCGTGYDIYISIYNSKKPQMADDVLKSALDSESGSLEKKPLLGEKHPPVIEKIEPGEGGTNSYLCYGLMTNAVRVLYRANAYMRPGPVRGAAYVWTGIPGQLLLAFSVYTNGAKLLSTKTPPGTLTCINGIRFLSMAWVILGHTYTQGMGVASNMNVVYNDMISRWTFQAILNGLLSVDSFFALSGLLVTYLALKEMKKKNGRLNWAMFYFHRFWRLTPPYMLIMGVYISLSRYWSDGPLWNTNGMEDNFCEDTWWKNLLYVNNVVDNKKQCFGHAWYLANDMQFYILSPLMFVPLFFFKRVGMVMPLLFLLANVITTYVISSDKKLPPTFFGGLDAKSTGDYMTDYYIMPYCRIGPYVIGVITGYLLYRTNGRFKLHWALNLLGWTMAIVLGVTITYGLHDPMNGNPMSVEVAALFNATHRTVWGACVCWVIFACATGNGGFINTLLSWEGFGPLGRLTYCAYLVHPPILSTFYYSLRNPVYFTDLQMISLYITFLVGANMVAFVASLAFESPMMGLEKVIFRRGDKK